MTDESNAGLGNEPASEDKLDSIIGSAIEATESPEVSETISDGRARDDKGRFAPKEPTAEASPEPADAVSTEVPAPAEPALEQPIEPPARWTADEKAKFAAWPRDVQSAVVERYKAIEADHTRKTQEAAEIRKSAEPWIGAVKPFEQYLQHVGLSLGMQPHDLVNKLIATEYQLRTGDPQQKFQAFHQLAQTYGIDLAALSRGEVALPDPTISNLRQQLHELTQWRTQFESQQEQQLTEQAGLHIDAFATAKDESGRPRYPHFERVRGIMGQIMANGQATTLEAAYQMASAPIQEAVAEELRSRQSHVETQRKEALSKAEKAAPVRSSGSQPGGQAKGRDLDSILGEAMSKFG